MKLWNPKYHLVVVHQENPPESTSQLNPIPYCPMSKFRSYNNTGLGLSGKGCFEPGGGVGLVTRDSAFHNSLCSFSQDLLLFLGLCSHVPYNLLLKSTTVGPAELIPSSTVHKNTYTLWLGVHNSGHVSQNGNTGRKIIFVKMWLSSLFTRGIF